MNREIKFKSYWKDDDSGTIRSDIMEIRFSYGSYSAGSQQSNYSALIGFCQFTGLKDKNGKEIYEGDIVRATQHIDGHFVQRILRIFIVVFDTFCFQFKPVEPAMYTVSLVGHEDLEVLGNIYENPDLLK